MICPLPSHSSSVANIPGTLSTDKQVLDVLRDAERGRIGWPSDQQRVSQSDSNSSKQPSPAAAQKLRLNQLPPEERQVMTLACYAGQTCLTSPTIPIHFEVLETLVAADVNAAHSDDTEVSCLHLAGLIEDSFALFEESIWTEAVD